MVSLPIETDTKDLHTAVRIDESPVLPADASVQALHQECNVFCQYLTGQLPTLYVVRKYVDYHQMADDKLPATRIDRLLVASASRSKMLTWLVDSYTGLFLRQGRFRVKMVVLLAILECVPPFHEAADGPIAVSRLRNLFSLSGELAAYGVSLAAATLLFGPLHAGDCIGRLMRKES